MRRKVRKIRLPRNAASHRKVTISHEEEDDLQRLIRYKNNPWDFLCECVYTLDQVDAKNPIKQFPQREYLKLYTKLWLKYPHIALPKSRRMTMSWTTIALYLWATMFHKGRFHAFVSKKEDDAGELVERAEFIYNHIPEDKIPKELLPKLKGGRMKQKPPVLEFEGINSKIQGFPMGADQLRQFTFSGILGDESAFWPKAEDFYSSSRPTLDGGGRMTLISSVAPGFFKRLCFDTFNAEYESDQPPKNAVIHRPMQGIRLWRNPENEFVILEIHFTADPLKRSKLFKETLQKTLPRRKYLQEYELEWDSFAGLPVYSDFGPHHSLHTQPEPHLGLPLLLGWDFGLTPSAIVGQLQGDQLVILREFNGKSEAINTFSPKVMNQLKVLYPQWHDSERDFRHYIDPAGFQRAQTDARTCAETMADKAKITQIYPGAPGNNDFVARTDAVEERLIKHTRSGPAIVLYEPTSPMLHKGFKGGYMYPESYGEIQPDKLRPLKNIYSHGADALQYLCWGCADLTRTNNINIPTPKYSPER